MIKSISALAGIGKPSKEWEDLGMIEEEVFISFMLLINGAEFKPRPLNGEGTCKLLMLLVLLL